jgi:methylated-DNA-[protein]-cysteine S-methyltransferase
MATVKYNSPIGDIFLSARNGAITELYFSGGVTTPSTLKETAANEVDTKILRSLTQELDAYFAGALRNFTVPLRLAGTPFRLKVWEALQAIPYGETISYKELANRVGNPAAIRAVGGANHHNPISIIVPCHRVIGANGKLVGYGGGLNVKEFLLELEKRNM